MRRRDRQALHVTVRRLARGGGAAIALALLAGACALGSGGQAAPQAAATGGAVDPEVERVWSEWFGGSQAAAGLDEERRAFGDRELALQECMAAAGQTYLPRQLGVNPVAEEQARQQQEVAGTRAFAERYGFGVVPPMAQEAVAEAYEERFPWRDPNAERFELLDHEERLAFLAAMFGPAAAESPGDDDLSLDRYETLAPEQGCAARVSGAAGALPAEAGQELNELDALVAADPRTVEALEAWSACMRGRGYEFRTREDARDHVAEQTGGGIPLSGEPEEVTVDVEGQGAVTLPVQRYDPAALQRAIDIEVAVAVADYDCGEETGVTEVEQRVRREVQLAWVGRWLDRLTAARDG